MAFDERLANRIREALTFFPESFAEKKMFGGIAFLLGGKMTVGAINKDLMVRVIGSKMNDVLAQEHVRAMDFTGKPMKEFVFVTLDGCRTEAQLQQWIELGVEHAKTKLKK